MVEDLSRIRYELERFLLGGAFELCEDDRRLASVDGNCAAAEIAYGKLVLSCWGEGWARSWRVLRAGVSPCALRLECARQMGRIRCTVERRRCQAAANIESSRNEFPTKLAAMIEANFAALKVERAVLRRDDRRNFTGIHARLLLKEQGRLIAAAGVCAQESQRDVDATLGAGLVWLDALRQRGAEVSRLLLFVPRRRSDTMAARLTAIKLKGASVTLCEVDELESTIQTVAPFDQGDLGDRWLEAIFQDDITAIDASLDARYAYSQVPAYRGEQRSFIDLLTATRDGRLVVIELKVTEDAEFPFQGLDYWLRIDWHRRRGDFARRGYFKQLPLADRTPLLYLVAPVFRFHATTKLIAASITPAVPITRIGINDDWRSGVRVLLSERLNGDE